MKSSVFIRTEVLAVGGKRHHFAEMLHLDTMTWHQISPLIQARGFHQFAIVYHHPGRNYYTFGGIDIMFPSASKLERWPSYEHIFRYNKQTDVWDIPVECWVQWDVVMELAPFLRAENSTFSVDIQVIRFIKVIMFCYNFDIFSYDYENFCIKT